MTTSAENNSVFRSFFEKQKLTGPKFIDWYRQLRLVLSTEDKKNYLEHPIPEASVAPPGHEVPPPVAAAHAAWVKGQKEVNELTAMFSKQAEQELLQTVREFHACKQEEGQSISSYVLKMNGYIDNLEVHKNQKNKPHKAAKGAHGKGKSKMGYAPNNMPFAPKPKTPSPLKKDNPVKDAICHQCDEIRHWRRNCPVYLTELILKKKLSQGASTSGSTGNCNGYVYLMKHKHEVFKTFKVFQKEVENQLGKTIKSLSFDRGGEYMSQEFLDRLKEHRIIDHRTPPYTPQHNGYPQGTIRYSFYNSSENKVFVAWNAEFFENDLIDLKASRSVEDCKIIQEKDTNPSLDTSLDHEEDDQEIDEPQTTLMVLESNKWLDAMNMEIQSMKDIDVWVLVELPPNARTVGSKWLFKKNNDIDGAVYVFKARLVAKGFTQTYRVDYEKTFSPVANIRATRILIAIAAYYDYEI
uniref:Reverse transcriptase Ty1/copia-type domain-containing protein n=1 Tax=Tanacetum cinerariifolium TaxID=118510 RepID=A0A6L2KT35_TANCI|nr:hypothetical protein [Tanacetum cinerariifolium]